MLRKSFNKCKHC